VTTEDTQTTTTDEESEDNALLAGFNETQGIEETTQATAVPADTQAAMDEFLGEVEGEPAAVVEPVTDAQVETAFNDLTQEEKTGLRALLSESGSLKQGLDKLAGTVGGINRTLQQLQAVQRTNPQGSAAAEGARKLEESIRAALEEEVGGEYPELAPRLIKGLTKAFSGATAQPAAPSVDVDAITESVEARVEERMNRKALAKAHPNWEAELALKDETGAPVKGSDGKYLISPAFKAWVATKEEGFGQKFMETNDADFVSDAITEFKTFRQTQSGSPAPAIEPAPAPAPAPAAVKPAGVSKQARLAAAAVPKGMPGQAAQSVLTEEDAFALGWKTARQGG